MFNKEKLETAMEILGDLSSEQKALIESAAEKPISDKELFEKLGSGIDEKKFTEFIKAAVDEQEEKVFGQELSPDELDAVAGGYTEKDTWRCVKEWRRNIYGMFWEGGVFHNIGFPDCAATVEDGSWCGDNDACLSSAVSYKGMQDCSKAWR